MGIPAIGGYEQMKALVSRGWMGTRKKGETDTMFLTLK